MFVSVSHTAIKARTAALKEYFISNYIDDQLVLIYLKDIHKEQLQVIKSQNLECIISLSLPSRVIVNMLNFCLLSK